MGRVWSPGGHTRRLKYDTTRVLFASTYTAKQMKTMYYCYSHSYIILHRSVVFYMTFVNI